MISRTTACRIANAHSEIASSEEMLVILQKASNDWNSDQPDFRDAFGRRKGLKLEVGVPTGTGHRIYDLAPPLALAVVTAHIGNKKAELLALMETARQELSAAAAQ